MLITRGNVCSRDFLFADSRSGFLRNAILFNSPPPPTTIRSFQLRGSLISPGRASPDKRLSIRATSALVFSPRGSLRSQTAWGFGQRPEPGFVFRTIGSSRGCETAQSSPVKSSQNIRRRRNEPHNALSARPLTLTCIKKIAARFGVLEPARNSGRPTLSACAGHSKKTITIRSGENLQRRSQPRTRRESRIFENAEIREHLASAGGNRVESATEIDIVAPIIRRRVELTANRRAAISSESERNRATHNFVFRKLEAFPVAKRRPRMCRTVSVCASCCLGSSLAARLEG